MEDKSLKKKYKKLITAIREKNVENVKIIIKTIGLSFIESWENTNFDPVFHTGIKYTPLHHAAETGINQIVIALLESGADVNIRALHNVLPIHIAAEKGYENIVVTLIDHGSFVNAATSDTKYCPIHFASEEGKERVVNSLLRNGATIDAKTRRDMTPLHLAIKKKHEKTAKLLLLHGADVNLPSDRGTTVLMRAVRNQCSESIIKDILKGQPDIMLNRGALAEALFPVNIPAIEILSEYGFFMIPEDRDYEQLMCIAVHKGYVQILQGLLDKGANVNKITYDTAYIHDAISYDQPDVLKLLLNYNCDVNLKDSSDNTPLALAVEQFRTDMIEQLLEKDAEIENDVFHFVVKRSLKTTKLFLRHGADVNVIFDGVPPIVAAVREDRLDIAELLIKHKAKIDLRICNGETPLHFAVMRNDTDSMTSLLKSGGVDVNEPISDGLTAIHCALISKADEKMSETLLKYGADVDAIFLIELTSDDLKVLTGETADETVYLGVTPLHVAIFLGNDTIAKSLLRLGATINYDYSRRKMRLYSSELDRDVERNIVIGNVLHLAVYIARYSVIEDLLKNGGDLDSRTCTGQTPLHLSIYNHSHRICASYLLQYGSDIEAIDDAGLRPLHVAILQGNGDGISMLLDFGADVNARNNNHETPLQMAHDLYPDYEESEDSICGILKRHVVKMKTMNLYVNEDDLPFICSDEMESFQIECFEEIEMTKQYQICNITLYDVLTKSVHNLARYANNLLIVQEMFASQTMVFEFPIFFGIAESRFKMAMLRRQMLDRILEMCDTLLPPLPEECLESILAYLNNKDLQQIFNVRQL